jgi:hypothetical protein
MRGMLGCVTSRLPFFLLLATALSAATSGLSSAACAEPQVAMAPQPEQQKCITVGDKRICLEEGAKKCIKIGGKRICLEGEDNGAGNAGGATKNTGNICEGEIACPPGYVVLDKPNKYGACCEPKEGFPETTPAPEGGGSAVPEDASSPEPTNADYAKCKVPQQKSFVGKGCLMGHDSSALPESKAAEYRTTCKGKSGIALCGPVPSRGGQFEC